MTKQLNFETEWTCFEIELLKNNEVKVFTTKNNDIITTSKRLTVWSITLESDTGELLFDLKVKNADILALIFKNITESIKNCTKHTHTSV